MIRRRPRRGDDRKHWSGVPKRPAQNENRGRGTGLPVIVRDDHRPARQYPGEAVRPAIAGGALSRDRDRGTGRYQNSWANAARWNIRLL